MIDKQAGKQIGRQVNKQASKQTGKQTGKTNKLFLILWIISDYLNLKVSQVQEEIAGDQNRNQGQA